MASSAGMKLVMPANAISAAKRACIALPPLRLMQGTSTNPATGSHTNPSMNVPVPFSNDPNAFYMVSAIAMTIAGSFAYFLWKKNMF